MLQEYYQRQQEQALALLKQQCGENLGLLDQVMQVWDIQHLPALLSRLCIATIPKVFLWQRAHPTKTIDHVVPHGSYLNGG